MASYNVGSNNPMAILTESQVFQIRFEIELGIPNIVLAKIHNVDFRTISSIKCRRNWRHI